MAVLQTEFTTCKALAEEFSVTQQRISQVLSELDLSNTLDKSKRPYLVPKSTAELVRARLSRPKSGAGKRECNHQNTSEELVKALKAQIAMIQQQLDQKDSQINALQENLNAVLETNKALSASTAIATAADKKQALLAPGNEEKQGFFSRLFGRRP